MQTIWNSIPVIWESFVKEETDILCMCTYTSVIFLIEGMFDESLIAVKAKLRVT